MIGFTGSELVVIEIAEALNARGWSSEIRCNLLGDIIARACLDISISDSLEYDLGDFDLIWVQHDLISAKMETLRSKTKAPLIVYASLSPFEPFEFPDLFAIGHLGAPLFVNSKETALAIFGRGTNIRSIEIFYNAAPDHFFRKNSANPKATLERLLIISNHVPSELFDSIRLFEENQVSCSVVGIQGKYERVTPELILDSDAVITIGKSVQYCIASKRPVFMYDAFGSGGWLTDVNFNEALSKNFSGRHLGERLSAEEIFSEVTRGFMESTLFINSIDHHFDLNVFRLGYYVDQLCAAASNHAGMAAFRDNLQRAFGDASFNSHVAFSSARQQIIRREYRKNRDSA
jgi:hypothetical protein